MAIENLVTTGPYPSHTSDLTTLQEVSDLLKETGRPVSRTTLRRWIAEYVLRTMKRGRADCVSFTAILQVHRDKQAAAD